MIFAASLFFSLLFWITEPLLMLLAAWIPHGNYTIVLIGLNALLYALILLIVRVVNRIYIDFDVGKVAVNGVRIVEWMDDSRCRWLNVVGIIGVGSGAIIAAISGKLPLPFWFLFVAVIVGLLDVARRNVPVIESVPLPPSQFVPDSLELLSDAPGKKIEYSWPSPVKDGLRPKALSFVISVDDAMLQCCDGLPRLPVLVTDDCVRCVRDEALAPLMQAVGHLRAKSQEVGLTPLQEFLSVINFVRGIPYEADEAQEEFLKFPVQTLCDKAGDQKAHVLLAASILHHLGHDVGLFFLKRGEAVHLALGYSAKDNLGPFGLHAANGHKYYFVAVGTDASADEADVFLQSLNESNIVTF
jgi:hypothetical protein